MTTTHRDQPDTPSQSPTHRRVIQTREAQIPVGPDGMPLEGDWVDAIIDATWIITDTHVEAVDDPPTG